MKIIDNINSLLGDDLKRTLGRKGRLKIAASCFSLYAYEVLCKELKSLEAFEFLFTEPAFLPDEDAERPEKERREFFIPRQQRESSLYGTEFEIHLRNKLTQRAIARECADWIRRKAAFRSNRTQAPMPQFACVCSPEGETVYSGIQGFTAVELGYQKDDAVSRMINCLDERPITSQYLTLFDQMWSNADLVQDVTETVCDHIASVYAENAPEHVYFLMLYHIFREFLEDVDEDVLPNDRTGYQNTLIWQKLFNYQRDAATGIINKLETYNGCILADSVGLGKTFTALAVIKYYELRNKSVLVLCPKKLAENWVTYTQNLKTNILLQDRFNYDVLFHTDLSRTSGKTLGIDLAKLNWGNYDLVVIDESHNFRNNDTYKDKETRYQRLMRRIIKEGVKTRVLMLSATPVNNRFTDLRNQLALAYEGHSAQLSDKLRNTRSIEEIFRQAQAAFNAWSRLPPEERTSQAILDTLDYDFFKLLDSVTIARSRKHIQTFYDTRDIGPFPERLKPLSYRCPLTSRADVPSLNAIFQELSRLELAVYAPLNYLLPSRAARYEAMYDTRLGGRKVLRQADRERSLQALMTTNLLKRLESSVEAFRLTLGALLQNCERALERVAAFRQSGKADFAVERQTDAWEEDEELAGFSDTAVMGGKISIDLADMDTLRWERDLAADQARLARLLEQMRSISPADDDKLQHLRRLIADKMAHPINGQRDSGNKKVLVFTAFADTARYLYAQLAPLLRAQGAHCALITGQGSPKSTLKTSYGFSELLTLFAPQAKSKALLLPDEPAEIDVLIATDCLSEGQNLQDCDYLVNYDIHWNPVRIIQRFGRIDRIGSPNARIQLVNYWPDMTLDDYIRLKERVENRMVIADITATGDDNVLTTQSTDMAYRREQLRRLQDEVIEMEDVRTGVSITDLGLNDFRMDLLHFIRTQGEPVNAPRGLHAVVPSRTETGLLPGAIFALRNRNEGLGIPRQNRLHPYYLLYVGEGGHMLAAHTDVKKVLDVMRAACKGQGAPLREVCRVFNERTDEGRDMTMYSRLLNAAIQSLRESREESDLDSLFTGGRTTALVDVVSGLNDFELLAFLVVI